MTSDIKRINLPLPFKLGSVNCYLVKTNKGYILVDTGGSNNRAGLEKELAGAGCLPSSLTLIVITHGDFDHIGNAAYLRERFRTKIAMHADDAGMAECGDMFWNRKKGNMLMRLLAPTLFRFDVANTFQPDLLLGDRAELSGCGLDAKILSIPGHSKGSIGILTTAGDLFCGDLIENTKQPALSSTLDDVPTAQASIAKLRSFAIKTIYPGHGKPFPFEQFP